MQLDPGKSWILDVPRSGEQRIWPRTGCSFDGKGNGSCLTGDCGGLLACKAYGQPPNSLAEFTTGQGQTEDFFNISLVEGFNVPMDFLPVPDQGGPGCRKGPRCTANITSRCPSELQAPGGCNNACTVFNQSKYCCTGKSSSCEPTTYSLLFMQKCPDAYTYSRNDSSSTAFTCPTGTNYQIVFCAPSDPHTPAASMPASTSIPTGLFIVLILASGLCFIFIGASTVFMVKRRRKQQRQEMGQEEEDYGDLAI